MSYIILFLAIAAVIFLFLVINKKNKIIGENSLKYKEIELKLQETIENNTQLTDELNKIQSENKRLTNFLSEEKINNSVLSEKVQNYKNLTDKLEEENQKFKSDVKLLNERILDLEKKLSNALEKADNLQKFIEKLENENNNLKLENKKNSQKILEMEKELSEIRTTQQQEKKNAEEKIALLQKAREELSEAFENLSNKILDQRLEKLEKANVNSIKNVINPLQTQIGDFKQKLEFLGNQQIKEQGKLLNELANLKNLNQKLSEEAANLSKALKGDKKMQGNWGEMRLKKIFEDSGLQEGIEYELQKSMQDDKGRKLIPDAIVHLPNNRDIIIDSKVSLVSYEKYFTTEDENIRERALKEFIFSIKNHIKELGAKEYDKLPQINSLDYVLMFIPIEAAYLTAIQKSRDIFDYAIKNSIMLVSPSTLLLALKTVNNLWQIEHQNRNIKEIVKRGEILYDKFVNFVKKLQEIGSHLDKAKNSYDNTYKLLASGKGNLISQAEKLKKLGISSNKSLPATLDFED